jgi:hypothetical protein
MSSSPGIGSANACKKPQRSRINQARRIARLRGLHRMSTSYRFFSRPKFVPKDFQITHKHEQTQRSRRGLSPVQLGYVHLIVWHNLIFRG